MEFIPLVEVDGSFPWLPWYAGSLDPFRLALASSIDDCILFANLQGIGI
jgi:hypothetical protein